MSRASSKLPVWQQASSPTYRRPSLVRRLRIPIIIAICFLLWRQYSSSAVPEKSRESMIESRRDRPSIPRRQTQIPQQVALRQGPAPSDPRTEEDQAIESVKASAGAALGHNGEQKEIPILERPTLERPALEHPTAERPTVERPAADKQPQTQKGDPVAAGNDQNKLIEQHEPTALVKQASQKLIDQYLSPAVKHEAQSEEEKAKAVQKKAGSKASFPVYSEYEDLRDQAEALPDVIHQPFEDTIGDVILQGWEDAWFSDAEFDAETWGKLAEPKIDFVYTWVNGSDKAFQDTIYPYEVNSTLNDEDGRWLESHRINRYRDWDELRYSIRTVEKYAHKFRNKIQLLVNAVADEGDAADATVEEPAKIGGRQRPLWMKNNAHTKSVVEILSQEDFFSESEQGCLPTFNSLTIENQVFNTKSDTDRFFALSDDMLLGKNHAASDIYSPLFGPVMGFKSNAYNTVNPPTDLDARRFGEKPFLIYTSWLLNRRFGDRKRKGQIHFGHSLSRSVMKEAIESFPRPALQSACQRFRGETGFQLYSWYVAFHYTIERHREVLLWSYIMERSDVDNNGNLDWTERQAIMEDLEDGMSREGQTGFRKRMFYSMSEHLEAAGLEAPKVNLDVQWTSLDGPAAIKDIECFEFNVNECLAPGFSTPTSDEHHLNYVFSTASIFDRVARQHPKCGDCLLKLLLNRVEKGLAPLLPHASTQKESRDVVIKALSKYQYTISDPDAFFVMVTDAEQVENVLFKRLLKKRGNVGQLCLNDDVNTEDEDAVADVRRVMIKLLHGMVPEPSGFERDVEDPSRIPSRA